MMNIPCSLELLYREAVPESLVIAISGIGTRTPRLWNHPSPNWLARISRLSLRAPAIYAFNHGIEMDSTRTWEYMFKQGGELLEAVLQLKDHDDRLRTCPILFIAHSLGGIILKEALCAAFSQTARVKPFRDSVAGTIFMGTPHSRSEEESTWNDVQMLLMPRSRFRKIKGIQEINAKRLAELSTQFERTAMIVPVLSIYETEETQTRRYNLSKTMLVGRQLAEIGATDEVMLAIATDHYNLCNIDVHGHAFRTIETFIEASMSKARTNIVTHAEQSEAHPTLDEATIELRLSASVAETTFHDGELPTSNQATQGTSQMNQDGPSDGVEAVTDPIFSKGDPKLPCFLVPVARNHDFCGRNEILDNLVAVLCQPGVAPPHREPCGLRTFAICGAGGMGKTQIATEFVHSHRDDFDAVFWLHAEEPTLLASEFVSIALQLGLVPEAPQDASNDLVAREIVKGWLEKPLKSYSNPGRTPIKEASWLLIFDNVPDQDALVDYWPAAGSFGSILLTSRDPLAKGLMYNVKNGLVLKEFSVEEASSLLLEKTWQKNDEKAIELAPSVVKMLGCVPLAIVQMASVIVREQLSFDDFIKRYEEEAEHGRLFKQNFTSRQRQHEYAHNIATVWLFDTLKFGMSLLNVLSLLDPDGIPEQMLESAIGLSEIRAWAKTVTAYQQARGELLNSSLVSRNRTNKKLIIHRLIQDAAWARLATLEGFSEEAHSNFDTAVALVYHFWSRSGYRIRHREDPWGKCAEYSPHLLRLKSRFARCSAQVREVLASNLDFADLLNEVGWYFQERGSREEATQCFEMARSNLESTIAKLEGAELPSSSVAKLERARFLLTGAHLNLGCSAAENFRPGDADFHFTKYYKMVQKDFENKPPGKDQRLAISYIELATAKIMLKKWHEAEKMCFLALDEAEKLEDSEMAKAARSLPQINLACIYILTDRADQAEPLLTNVFKEREEMYGPNDRVSMITGRALHAMGLLKEAQGQLEESFEYQKRALDHMKETAGLYHHRTADMYFKVAQHLVRLDDREEATRRLDQALKVYQNADCYCAERGRVFFWKAKLSNRQHDHEEARTYLVEALKLYRQATNSEDMRAIELLDEKDFDELVTFWSK